MPTLTEFLLARIAEDEALARDTQSVEVWYTEGRDVRGHRLLQGVAEDDPDFDEDMDVFTAATKRHAAHIMRHAPARILAECEAKRRIVEALRDRHPHFNRLQATREAVGEDQMHVLICRLLAQPYADHPDFDEAWRP